MTEPPGVTAALSTRQGTAGPTGDAATIHTLSDRTTAAALIDGIGHSARVSRIAALLADVTARVAARRGALAGLLAAGELITDPGPADNPEPDAVAATAITAPCDNVTRVAWVGDVRVWGWDGNRLRLHSTDQTMGQFLRVYGGPAADLAPAHDNWVRVSLSTAVVATVRETELPEPLVLLTTDGIHDTVPRERLEALIREHGHHPQTLANQLTVAALPGRTGERDDATAVVLLRA